MLETMTLLLGDVRRHVLFEHTPPIFNMEAFLAGQPEQTWPFYKCVPVF